MSLRETATADLNNILAAEFARDITITDPDDNSAVVKGFTNDVAQVIDPETGQLVSGRIATIAIALRELTAAGLEIPEGIEDTTKKPWRINFEDMDGAEYHFKVFASNPDRALGVVTCELEIYND